MFEIHGKRIPATLSELVDPRHTALLLWDMENAIAPNAFNYKDILGNLKMLAARWSIWMRSNHRQYTDSRSLPPSYPPPPRPAASSSRC